MVMQYAEPYDDYWGDEDDLWEDETDEWEEALANCGYVPGEGCTLAGSEECDFVCLLRDDNYRHLGRSQAAQHRERDARGRFTAASSKEADDDARA